MTLRARACYVSLDYSDGLCTTHGSHSREGSDVGLDTYGKRSSENTKPRVSQDLFPLRHGLIVQARDCRWLIIEKAMPQGVEKTSPQLFLGHAQLLPVLFLTS